MNRQNVENENTDAASRAHTAEPNHPYVDRTWSLSTKAYKIEEIVSEIQVENQLLWKSCMIPHYLFHRHFVIQ